MGPYIFPREYLGYYIHGIKKALQPLQCNAANIFCQSTIVGSRHFSKFQENLFTRAQCEQQCEQQCDNFKGVHCTPLKSCPQNGFSPHHHGGDPHT